MHPSANMKARAEFTESAPSAHLLTIPNPEKTRPDAMSFTCLRTPVPTSALWVRRNPSVRGMPIESENSKGAAPVPPSAPSTVMKSGQMPVSTIACARASSSSGLPTHILSPIGLPSDSSRNFAMKSINERGSLNAECAGGELQSSSIEMPRAAAMAGVILDLGSMPPCAGFAPCESLISIILTEGIAACSVKRIGSKPPSFALHPK
mmetsp:Transcript_43094/g.99831  ORF Transcript_43094/g.99831 Transcript_43094/m.99831 type:complete len:207 (-) Transcript_43094:828-1448(-)